MDKSKNPQRDWLKKLCSIIYYLGLGSLWYEETHRSNLYKIVYGTLAVIGNIFLFANTTNEFLGHLQPLNEKEKNDLAQFTLAHFCLNSKIVCAYIKRKQIKIVLKKLLEGFREFVVDELDAACVKKSTWLCVWVVVITYLTLLSATVDAVMVHFAEDIPIRTEVTYYPTRAHTDIVADIVRILVNVHWWYLVSTMLSIDCLCISSLVIVGHKFKVLQAYFISLNEKVTNNVDDKTKEELADDFTRDFIFGIQMHEDALWCAKNVQDALGNLYSVQVFESVVLLVMCLVKIVTMKINLVFFLANLAYVMCVVSLTGAYMLAAGDITHEAGGVDTAMFHSGWEQVSRKELRTLAVLALQRSQVPVYMTSFGIIILSYTNFISVLRSSYSFFAVMY